MSTNTKWKRILLTVVVVIAPVMVACTKRDASTEQQAAIPPTPELETVVPRDHYYDYQDGMQYGYTLAVSADDKAAGKASSQVTMFFYAGERGGRYQLHTRQANMLSAIECTMPCDVAKVLTIMDAPGVPASTISVNRVRFAPNSVAYLALTDAANGKLNQYGLGDTEKQYTVWVDQDKGILRERFKRKNGP
jgi:hypothetical protein